MPTFSVWAPSAERVHLLTPESDRAMDPAGHGWWTITTDFGQPGDRYSYSCDGGPARPDPRSAYQPEGVHGPSEVVDHSHFRWHDANWGGVCLAGAVLYEMHIGTFTNGGTFDDAIERLGHLVELGIDAVELLPVAEFAGTRGWGYDGVNLYAPHHCYGGPEGLKRFVDACHASGIGVVMDVVYNHLGPVGNYLNEFGPYLSDRHQTQWGSAVNLDGQGSAEVRRYFIDNALMWLRDYHCDGLRLDAVHSLIDTSAVHLVEQLTAEVDALRGHLRRPVFVIAESDLNDPRFVRSRDAGGYGADAAWADDWHHALHAQLTGETAGYYEDFAEPATLPKALREGWVYDGTWSAHRDRHHGRSPAGLAGRRFVVCTQNHDQVGNRAAGERTSALMGPGRLLVAAALLLTSPFTPMLFQGEEWGASTPWQYFTDFDDPDVAEAVTSGRRSEFAAFGWRPDDVPDPQSPETFARSVLRWDEVDSPEHSAVLGWYRLLLALRRRYPSLTDDRLDAHRVEWDGQDHLMVHRASVTVLANLATTRWRAPAPLNPAAVIAASDLRLHAGEGFVDLPADSVAILVDADRYTYDDKRSGNAE